MRILQVIGGIVKAAGTSVFCVELSDELVRSGNTVAIAVSNPDAADAYPSQMGVPLLRMSDCNGQVLRENWDVVHLHGIWEIGLFRLSCAAHRAGVKVVWSPHGMLTPWALGFKAWKKKLALFLYLKRELARADALHVTAQSEIEDVRRLGLRNQVIVAPLGVRMAGKMGEEKITASGEKKCHKTLLFVSRVHRKKGLPTLLTAWAQIPSVIRAGWQIRIVGPDQDNHTAELQSQAVALGIADEIVFAGPKYGAELADEYRTADLFALPTHSENFGSVVIEALSYGLPVICTREAPWEELETRRCGWWVEDSVKGAAAALVEGLTLSDEVRHTMGERGRRLVREKYTWEAVCDAVAKGYERTLAS